MNSEAAEGRDAILKSIREHLFASTVHDAVHGEIRTSIEQTPHPGESAVVLRVDAEESLVERFKESLEAVDGNCLIVENETALVQTLEGIINSLSPSTPRIAVSDAPVLRSLAKELGSDVSEIAVTPDVSSLFDFDIGITAVQAAIAETGTLVLESDRERNRLVSLVPPVHIAIVEANQLCLTLGEALAKLHSNGGDLSPAITFITGPSRTADIELTLAIGVHGPRKLFVIIKR